jgi:hypothetical protein
MADQQRLSISSERFVNLQQAPITREVNFIDPFHIDKDVFGTVTYRVDFPGYPFRRTEKERTQQLDDEYFAAVILD